MQRLTEQQRDLVHGWLSELTVIKNHSWGTIETTVLEVTGTPTGTGNPDRFIIKAGGASDHHMAREIHAYQNWTDPWQPGERIPRLFRADSRAKLLITHYLDGELTWEQPSAEDPGTYHQAGALLADLHAHSSQIQPEFEVKENRKMLWRLEEPHRICAKDTERLRDMLGGWPTPPATIVPTHGDWSPRNWLLHRGQLRAIDLGRADLRPNYTDFVRLAFKQFHTVPGAEAAFFDGYGSDPREPETWFREQIRQAVATAVWAYGVGDEAFEREGHQYLARLLASAPG